MRQWWALGRTKDGLKADPEGAPASAASEPESMSWAEIDPAEVLGRRRGRWFLGMVGNGELPKVSSEMGGAWGRREGV